uniref:WAT1-related protein n=1 Tax=Kalanchoe fedtschenkoi TaxID=63787 RepID=A0A7N0VFN9_KALFE
MTGPVATSYLPLMAMIFVQAGYAGLNILSKLAMEDGLHPYILVPYRQIIATFALAPLAFLFERYCYCIDEFTAILGFQVAFAANVKNPTM